MCSLFNAISIKGEAATWKQITETFAWAHVNDDRRKRCTDRYPVQMRTPVKTREITKAARISYQRQVAKSLNGRKQDVPQCTEHRRHTSPIMQMRTKEETTFLFQPIFVRTMIYGKLCGKDYTSSKGWSHWGMAFLFFVLLGKSTRKWKLCLYVLFHLQSQLLNLIIFLSGMDKFRSGKSIAWQSFECGTSRIKVYSVTPKATRRKKCNYSVRIKNTSRILTLPYCFKSAQVWNSLLKY